jgi:hypothetical protein
VTVCIVARAGNQIVGATDRMLTAADIQFEPTAGSKLFALTNSIFLMTSGEAALQAEICGRTIAEVNARISVEPQNWWLVADVADAYVKHYNAIKQKRAERQILATLNLDGDSFIAQQQLMSEKLVSDIARELMNFEMPGVSTLIAGIDPRGAHIYQIHGNEPNCLDTVGFAAIGSEGRHATSQFMLARHAWNADFADTLMLTYLAKRRSEVAPGVGTGTDMMMVGPALGSILQIGDHVIARLGEEYDKIARAEAKAFERSKEHTRAYVQEISAKSAAAGVAAGDNQAPPPPAPDGATPPNGPDPANS